jgi:tetratricopeptide (TPR) repeat protein
MRLGKNKRLWRLGVGSALALGVCAALSLGGCGNCGGPPAPATPDATPDAAAADARKAYVPPKRLPLAAPHRVLNRPRSLRELPTTDWSSYWTNVRGQMRSTRVAFKEAPVSPASRRQLGWRIYTWAELHRDPAHFAEVVELASGGLEGAAVQPELMLMRAEALFGLGRAKEALADVEAAAAMGSKSRRVLSLRAELLWHLHRDEAAQKAMRDELAARPGVHIMSRAGLMEWELGNLAEAERLFATAETKITNTAPAPVVWLYVQRGLLHLEQGRAPQALKFLRAAHARGTGYPMAIVALSRAEIAAGNPARAVALMEALVRDWPRPDHRLVLAQAYTSAGRADAAATAIEAAWADCAGLTRRFPNATAAQCAETARRSGKFEASRRLAEVAMAASPSKANRARLADLETADP